MNYLSAGAVLALLTVSAQPSSAQDSSFDGLVKVDDAKMALAYINPEVDFSVYKRVMLVRPIVAFKSNWLRDQNRGRGPKVTAEQMEEIRKETATLLRDVFAESLDAGGYEVTTKTDHDVLLVKPALINLDIQMPQGDSTATGVTRTYTATASSGTIYLELYDSVSGAILARGAEATAARNAGNLAGWSQQTIGGIEAKRIFSGWAKFLVDFLDSYYHYEDDDAAE